MMKTSFHGKKRLFGFFFAALLAMAVLGGCADGTGESSGDNSSKEPEKASVVVGIQQDIDSLDPQPSQRRHYGTSRFPGG